MKPQFQTRTLLLFTAAAAISFCAYLEWHRWASTGHFVGGTQYGAAFGGEDNQYSFWRELQQALVPSFIWLPLIFAAYSIGRRSLTVRNVLVFAVAEALAIWFWRQPCI